LHIVTSAGCTELLNASNLVREANATRTLNTPIHGRLNEGTEVFILDSALASDLVETRPV
jgi:hypothetical protein